MAFNTTFNNISAISWCSVFLLEETAVTGEKLHIKYVEDWKDMPRSTFYLREDVKNLS
jgi:hypothetical protein